MVLREMKEFCRNDAKWLVEKLCAPITMASEYIDRVLSHAIDPARRVVATGLIAGVATIYMHDTPYGQVGGLFSGAQLGPTSFQGNPNAAVTAIGGSIVTSRDGQTLSQKQTPFFIQVSASSITGTGSSNFWKDGEFWWDFGDVGGTEIFTNPATGQLVDANISQVGPEAVYCYRTAGTKTITCRVRAANGAGGYTTATLTTTVQCQSFSASTATYYVDPTGGNDAWTGTAPAFTSGTTGPVQTLARLQALANFKSGLDLLIARGTHSVNTTDNFQPSGNMIGVRLRPYTASYGSANPVIEMTSSTPALVITGGSSSPGEKTDWVISSIEFRGTGNFSSSFFSLQIGGQYGTGAASVTSHDFYTDNCPCYTQVTTAANSVACWDNTLAGDSSPRHESCYNWGIWGGCCTALPGDLSYGNSISGGGWSWGFYVGISDISGQGAAGGAFQVGTHHMYPDVWRHACFRWINFGAGGGRNFCLNGNWDSSPNYKPCQALSWSANVASVQCNSHGQTGTFWLVLSGASRSGYNTSNFAAGGTYATVDDANNFHYTLTSDPGGTATATGANQGMNFRYSYPFTGASDQARWYMVDGCNFTGTASAIDVDNSDNNVNQGLFAEVVIQNSAFHGMVVSSQGALWTAIAVSYTVRDCRVWDTVNSQFFNPTMNPDSDINGTLGYKDGVSHTILSEFYRNRIYVPAASSNSQVVGFYSPTNLSFAWSGGVATATYTLSNQRPFVPDGVTDIYTIISASRAGYNGQFTVTYVYNDKFTYSISDPGGTATGGQALRKVTTKQVFTDNIIWDARAAPKIWQTVIEDLLAAGALIDRNTYYSPGGNSLYATATAKTLAQWKAIDAALDPNSVSTQPAGWTTPPSRWSDLGA